MHEYSLTAFLVLFSFLAQAPLKCEALSLPASTSRLSVSPASYIDIPCCLQELYALRAKSTVIDATEGLLY